MINAYTPSELKQREFKSHLTVRRYTHTNIKFKTYNNVYNYEFIYYHIVRLYTLNRCFGMFVVRHSTHHNKFLVATNGLILYVVSWQAARSILPPSYRAATHSSQFKHTVHRTLLILEKFNGYKS